MLILSRRQGQRITLGDDIVIHVVGISRRAVRLGVEAPGSVRVYRAELAGVDQEEQSAANSPIQPKAATSEEW